MLEFVRGAVKSWVAKVLLGLLVASFAVFGIGDVFTNGLGSSVASVGGQKITVEQFSAAFNREMRAVQQRFGQPVDTTLARQMGLDQQVLSRLAAEATLDEAIADLALSAPDEAVADVIVSDPSFQGANGFDQENYAYQIAQAGYTVETYEESVRKTLARNQLSAAIVGGASAPPGYAEALYNYRGETRRIDYIQLEVTAHAPTPPAPDEAALKAFHEANPQPFSRAEQRDLVWLHIDISTLGADFEPDEAALRDLYDNRKAIYDLPERRALYQIVFDVEADATAAAARLAAGEIDFDGLLAERSETRDDVSLGDLTREELQEATGEAAFALNAPGIAGPVDTGFGFAIIEIAAITPAEVTPFEDARPELVADLRREAALDEAPGLAGDIDDLRAGGSTLEEIATEMGVELHQAQGVERAAGGQGLLANGQFMAEAFAAELDEERDVFELRDGSYFVVRVDGVEEAALRPLENVRDLVALMWTANEAMVGLEAKAITYEERVDEGELLAAIADELGVNVQTEGPQTRADGWATLPPEQIEALFSLPMGHAITGRTPGREDVVTIAQVVEINAPDADQAQLDELTAQLDQMAGSDALQLFVSAKQQEVEVSVNAPLLDSLLSSSQAR